ncbi:hypothetical protein [Ideonella dechloratans]|uniref:hypothetical protein n=1 Tax=Ideonella dechloratans TaxID=36863 RepID=UPI0035AF07AF
MQVYTDILVAPVQALLAGFHGGAVHQAGPIYPDFDTPSPARHWRAEVPVDVCPRPPAEGASVDRLEGEALWGGCLVNHFGHFLAEFVHRLLPAAQARPELPILYVTRPGQAAQPLPGFIQAVFAYLGVAERVRVLDRPTRVDRLWVAPQAERLGGSPPAADYLAVLATCQARLPAAPPGDVLFVSRAGVGEGLVGEGLLERYFETLGAQVYRPELHPLPAQLATYLAHAQLVFTEGSALHGLQLLGRLPGEVTVLSRRPGRFGQAFLASRVAALHHVPLAGPAVHGRAAAGRSANWVGLVYLDTAPLAALARRLFPAQAPERLAQALSELQDRLAAEEAPATLAYLRSHRGQPLWQDRGAVLRDLAGTGRLSWPARLQASAALAGLERVPTLSLSGALPPVAALCESTPSAAWLALLGQVADGVPDPGLWTVAEALGRAGGVLGPDWVHSDVLTGALLGSLAAADGAMQEVVLSRPEPWRDPAAAADAMPVIQRLVLLRLACPARFRYRTKLRLDAAGWQALRRAPLPVWQRCVLAWFHLLLEGRWPVRSPEPWARALRALADPGAPPRGAGEEADPWAELQRRLAAWLQSDRPEAQARVARWLARRAHPAASSFSDEGAGQGSPSKGSGTG